MQDSSFPGFLGVDDYLAQPREKNTWLLKPFIPTSGAALLYGDPKVGKSYLGIQLSLAISGDLPDFLGFQITKHGRVLYLQLDTPRSVWAHRFEDMLSKGGLPYNNETMLLADRESIRPCPFDILQPQHAEYLASIVKPLQPVAVVIDTLREAHSGDEDSSTTARNVIANLVAATEPAALILISHGRKPHPDTDKDLLADHRGSSYITGRMDAIMRLTKGKLYYTGRSIEAGDIRIERTDSGLWQPVVDEGAAHVARIVADTALPSLRSKAKVLAPLIAKSEEATMSMLRRYVANQKFVTANGGGKGEVVNVETGEIMINAQ